MWTQEMLDFDNELTRTRDNFLILEKNKLKAILQLAIMQSVYLAYDPHWYTRKFQLMRSVDARVNNSVLYVFINTQSSAYYYSAISGSDQTENVPYYIQFGHEPRSYYPNNYNMFHYYPARRYLELAQNIIESFYGYRVEIDLNIR